MNSAFVTNIQGKSAAKHCICIPLDDSDLYVGEKTISLDIVAFELQERKFGQMHMVKVSMKKEDFDALTEDQRSHIPILGNMKPLIIKQSEMNVTGTMGAIPGEGDDLPF